MPPPFYHANVTYERPLESLQESVQGRTWKLVGLDTVKLTWNAYVLQMTVSFFNDNYGPNLVYLEISNTTLGLHYVKFISRIGSIFLYYEKLDEVINLHTLFKQGIHNWGLAWTRLCNFMVVQVKFNRLL